MIVCPHCHHQNSDALSQCEACYSALPAESSCHTCGQQHWKGSKYCGFCGVPFLFPACLDLEPTRLEPASNPPQVIETSQPTLPHAELVHQPTRFRIRLDTFDSPISLGKPNPKVRPDINIASFQHAEIVSRIHADILVEESQFFIQDKGSSNGTFVNDQLIRPKSRHQLASGDKISLGKGNLVTFTFELS